MAPQTLKKGLAKASEERIIFTAQEYEFLKVYKSL